MALALPRCRTSMERPLYADRSAGPPRGCEGQLKGTRDQARMASGPSNKGMKLTNLSAAHGWTDAPLRPPDGETDGRTGSQLIPVFGGPSGGERSHVRQASWRVVRSAWALVGSCAPALVPSRATRAPSHPCPVLRAG